MGFLEAHHQALEEFLKKHGDTFPNQTLPDFKAVDEYSSAAALNEFYMQLKTLKVKKRLKVLYKIE